MYQRRRNLYLTFGIAFPDSALSIPDIARLNGWRPAYCAFRCARVLSAARNENQFFVDAITASPATGLAPPSSRSRHVPAIPPPTKAHHIGLATEDMKAVQRFYDFYVELLFELHLQNSSAGYDQAALPQRRSEARAFEPGKSTDRSQPAPMGRGPAGAPGTAQAGRSGLCENRDSDEPDVDLSRGIAFEVETFVHCQRWRPAVCAFCRSVRIG